MSTTIPFKTSDLHFAAFLKVAEVPFLEAKADPGERRVYFYFEAIADILDFKRDYFNRTAKVSALTFGEEIKALKSLIHNL